MKWIGVYLLSFLLWVIIAAFEAMNRHSRGESVDKATSEAASTIRGGMLCTAVLMLGVWFLTR